MSDSARAPRMSWAMKKAVFASTSARVTTGVVAVGSVWRRGIMTATSVGAHSVRPRGNGKAGARCAPLPEAAHDLPHNLRQLIAGQLREDRDGQRLLRGGVGIRERIARR